MLLLQQQWRSKQHNDQPVSGLAAQVNSSWCSALGYQLLLCSWYYSLSPPFTALHPHLLGTVFAAVLLNAHPWCGVFSPTLMATHARLLFAVKDEHPLTCYQNNISSLVNASQQISLSLTLCFPQSNILCCFSLCLWKRVCLIVWATSFDYACASSSYSSTPSLVTHLHCSRKPSVLVNTQLNVISGSPSFYLLHSPRTNSSK